MDAQAGIGTTHNPQLRVLQACLAVSDKALQLTALYNSIANSQALVFATANSTRHGARLQGRQPCDGAAPYPSLHRPGSNCLAAAL